MAYQHPDPFWDFIRSFDPNTTPGANNAAAGGAPPEFLRGFPFFHPAHAHPGHPHHHHRGAGGRHRGRRHAQPHQPWAGPWAWAEWAGPEQAGAASQPQNQEAGIAQPAQQQAAAADEAPQASTAQDKEKTGSPDTLMDDSDVPDPAEVTPDEDEDPQANNTNPPPYGRGHGRRGAGRRCRDREGCRRTGNSENPFPFDLNSLLTTLSSHPFVQNLQAQAAEVAQAATAATASPSGTFSPPLDLFSTPSAYILHLAIPGALKSDIGVDWDPERNILRVAGVVHRPGDEEFQKSLVQGERPVGEFKREVRLPPKTWAPVDGNAREDEIDADGITAKMEDGVLVVTVPKVEKEWTEIRKVDIE